MLGAIQLIDLHPYLVYDPQRPMLFNSQVFAAWFMIIYLVFILIKDNRNLRIGLLFAFSLFFYYKSSGIFFVLLIVSTIMNFLLGNAIFRSGQNGQRKTWLWLSVIFNLGMLGYYKYTNFLIDTVNAIGTSTGIADGSIAFRDIFLPVGISFFTFQAMSYTIDIYRGKMRPVGSIFDFGFFLSFFPQLVAGPIVRAADFIPQIRKKLTLTRAQLSEALFLIIGGLFKKAVISDYISVNFVDRVFENPALYSPFEVWSAFYGYALQIYCDFSGYSDMAIGLALLMGFRLPLNFDVPYQATSLTEFWRRWHISLSSWLRDYLYISLGGNRKGKYRTYFNLMVTMLLGGLWHGASWKFVMWGGLHGALLMIERALKPWLQKIPQVYRLFPGWFFTFHFVGFAWIYFRADSFQTAGVFIRQLFMDFDWQIARDVVVAYPWVFILLAIGYLLHFLPKSFDYKAEDLFTRAPLAAKAFVTAFVIWLVIQASSSDVVPFIYFQF